MCIRDRNIDMLIEMAAAYEKTSYKGLFHFVRYIEDVYKRQEQLLDISSRQSALDYLLSNEVDDRWCEMAAAVMLYDASVSDAGDGKEVDDKEFTQKNSVERLINAKFEHYSKMCIRDRARPEMAQ